MPLSNTDYPLSLFSGEILSSGGSWGRYWAPAESTRQRKRKPENQVPRSASYYKLRGPVQMPQVIWGCAARLRTYPAVPFTRVVIDPRPAGSWWSEKILWKTQFLKLLCNSKFLMRLIIIFNTGQYNFNFNCTYINSKSVWYNKHKHYWCSLKVCTL